MKKYLVVAAAFLCVGVASADKRLIPTGEPQSLATADYGGVDYSTWTINFLLPGGAVGVNFGTATTPSGTSTNFAGGVFYGVLFGSGTSADFVDVWDSSSADRVGPALSATWRIYQVANSTTPGPSYAVGFSGPPKPIRFNRGLIYRPSRADFNTLNLLYYQYP